MHRQMRVAAASNFMKQRENNCLLHDCVYDLTWKALLTTSLTQGSQPISTRGLLHSAIMYQAHGLGKVKLQTGLKSAMPVIYRGLTIQR